jgi:poly(3-hydroxybutyrate) depolymerase
MTGISNRLCSLPALLALRVPCGAALTLGLTLVTAFANCQAAVLIGPGQDEFDREVGTFGPVGALLNFEFFRPPGYEQEETDLPLVVFLHGFSDGQPSLQPRLNTTMRYLVHATQRDNVERLPRGQEARAAQADDEFAAFLMVPKIPVLEGWTSHLGTVRTMIDDFVSRYGIDDQRIYLAGYSNGAFATTTMIEANPGLFAAGASISGGSFPSPSTIDALVDFPFWIIHGTGDTVVPPDGSLALHDALVDAGSIEVRLSVLRGGHDAGFLAIFRDTNDEFYPWLFSHTLAVPEPGALGLVLMMAVACPMCWRSRQGITPF